jgi:excisionase family DNA binding protein
MEVWEPLGGEFLTPAEAAKVFRVTEGAVKSAAARGDIPAVRIGRSWRIFTAATRLVPMTETATEGAE